MNELSALIEQAKTSSIPLAEEIAEQTERWLTDVASGKLTKIEFQHLLESQKRLVMQQLNTRNIQAQTAVRSLLLKLLAKALKVVINIPN